VFGNGGVVAVNGGGGGEEEAFHAGGGGGFEDVEQAGDVEGDAFVGGGDGFGDADEGGKVIDVVDAGEGGAEEFAVEDGASDEAGADAVEVALVAGAEVVEDEDFGVVLEGFGDVAADETAAAGDEDFFHVVTVVLCNPFRVVFINEPNPRVALADSGNPGL